VVVFLFEVGLGQRLEGFLETFGVIPARYFYQGFIIDGEVVPIKMSERIIPLFSSMFLHGGWIHLLGNMLYLWIFGDNVEDRVGHFRYVVFYLLCGLSASGAHILANPESTVPSIGASGAIAGVLGAYVMLYPHARVAVLFPIIIFFQVIQLPAVVVLGLWFFEQFLNGTLALTANTAATGGVAWWAHIGGFLTGMIFVHLFKRRRYRPVGRDMWWVSRGNF